MIKLEGAVNGPVLVDPWSVMMAHITPIKAKLDNVDYHLGIKFTGDSGLFTLMFEDEADAVAALESIYAACESD